MKQQSKPRASSAAAVSFSVTCAVILGLSGAYFAQTSTAKHAKATQPAPAPRAAQPLRNEGGFELPRALAPEPTPAREVATAPAALAEQTTEASPELAPLPAPPALPEPTAAPAAAEQDPAWKAGKTKAIQQVVSSRAERLERDIAERERVGDVSGAAELRVLAARVKKQLQAMDGELNELAALGTDKPR